MTKNAHLTHLQASKILSKFPVYRNFAQTLPLQFRSKPSLAPKERPSKRSCMMLDASNMAKDILSWGWRE
jgi:hypothetical protein